MCSHLKAPGDKQRLVLPASLSVKQQPKGLDHFGDKGMRPRNYDPDPLQSGWKIDLPSMHDVHRVFAWKIHTQRHTAVCQIRRTLPQNKQNTSKRVVWLLRLL